MFKGEKPLISSERAFETKLNVLLGHLLSRELGIRAMSEYISRRDRPDIIVYVNGAKIVLEGSYSKADAERDVVQRIEKGIGDLGLALFYKDFYPQNLTDSELEERLKASKFEVRLVVPEDISGTLLAYFEHQKIEPRWITGWMEARVQDLISIINEAIQFIVSEKDINEEIGKIERKIKDFVMKTKSIDLEKLIAERLYNLFYKLYGLSVGDYREIDELIYAKAGLTIFLSATFYQSARPYIPRELEELTTLCKKYGYRLGLRTAFEAIWNFDYRPIYGLALQIIDVLPDELSLALKDLVELAEESASKRNLLRRDFSGKIYHKIVGDWAVRKNFATYFTTVPAAYLLAYLSIFTRTGVFSDFRRVVAGDLACGSGTLLTATYNALKDLYIYSRLREGYEVDLKEFHKQMLEEGLWGIDALRYAVQIASTNLALQDPSTSVNCMNFFAVPLGEKNKSVVLGSLEFIKGGGLPSVAMYLTEKPSVKFLEDAETASITGGEVPSKLPEFDFIIMNPPFTRATGRGGRERGGLFGFIPDKSTRENILKRYIELRKEVQEDLKKMVYGKLKETMQRLGIEEELSAIGQAGEGLLFLYMALKRVKDEGKIAFVLPKSLLTGTSWFLARCLLVNKFHLEHIVISYDTENGYNFSESTSLSEALIVARKRESPEESEETTITILHKKPSTSLEARALAFKILSSKGGEYIEINGTKAYTYKVSRKELTKRIFNWGELLAFPDPQLTRIACGVLDGRIFGTNVPMIMLGEIATIGIDRHQFHDAFQVVHGRLPSSYPAIHGGEEERRLRMLTEPNARIIAREMKTKKGIIKRPGEELFKNFSSILLNPDRIWVDTAHVIALCSTEPVISNIFYTIRLKNSRDINRLKALCLWLNTTWGILSILANRSETRGRWINLKMTHWRLQPVLNVMELDEEKIKRLAAIFDKYCRSDLPRLPKQFNPDNVNPIRKGIDEEFLEVLGVKFADEDLNSLYRLIYQNLSMWIGES
jgi:type I restriction-modification system DNA methylase subunit